VASTFLGSPPSNEHTTIDHIDRDGENNKVENLQWATKKDQSRNLSHNRHVIMVHRYSGEVLILPTIADAAEKIGICQKRLSEVLLRSEGQVIKKDLYIDYMRFQGPTI
jgi:hypothetical protein